MQESIEAILRLSQEDRSMQANRNLLETFPDKKKKLRVNLDQIGRRLDELNNQKKDLEPQIKEREALISIENDKVLQADEKMLAVKNQKEYYAMQKEIDTAKKTIKRMEDQILQIEEKVTPINEELKLVKLEFEEEKLQYENKTKSVLEDEEKIQSQIKKYDRLKIEVMNSVDPALAAEYEELTERKLIPAAVEISGPYCLGCAMAIPAQKFNEIIQAKRGECPHCHRILFYKAPEQKPKPKPVAKKKRKKKS
jgi:predicted  nucleic acid-binding Zn-ribbon protein